MRVITNILAAAAALAALGGCATVDNGTTGDALAVRDATDQGAGFASQLKGQAVESGFYRIAGDEAGAIQLSLDAYKPYTFEDGRNGFTYLITWERGGVQLGRHEDDCRNGDARTCAQMAIHTVRVLTKYYDGKI